ncbi:MAG: hypothetical protein GY737_32265 [Desulfobacteraceae bacterium]|nr:hypothetical protein [Desulfobacteraceae bacterium]
MKKQNSKIILFIVLSSFFFCCAQNVTGEESQANTLMPQTPRYELVLDMNELTILCKTVSDGLNKYGGSANFEMNAAKNSKGTLWRVIIDNPKLPDVLTYWVSEKSLAIVKSINPDNLTPNNKLLLKVVKGLSDKIDAAKKNPIRDRINISGKITEEKGNLFIKGKGFQYSVSGKYTDAIKKKKGRQVVLSGVVKVKNQIEATRLVEKKDNTLELFVMSQCPFGQMAETSLINYIDTLPDDQRPDISIRYIFNLKNNKFTSMHGEPEIAENLVQMVVRDEFQDYFHPYLLQRCNDMERPWREVAKEIGISDKKVAHIENKIATERKKLILAEYNYAVLTYDITDRSPTYVWESEIISDVRKIEVFKDLVFSTDKKCSQ